MMNFFDPGYLYDYTKNKEKLLSYLNDSKEVQEIFDEFLLGIKVETFLIEDDYVDKDYLVDYANYFARCHKGYGRFCLRIHFFSKSKEKGFLLTNEIFDSILCGSDSTLSKKINKMYLGFIVLREFKNNKFLVGRSCLAHYPENENRFYTATRNYSVNLYGIALSVKTMAFQEQDQTTAVCASIALWSAFNITGIKYQHPIPSPSEVTKLALSESSYSRQNEGLSVKQIAVGISKLGLNPAIIQINNNREFKSIAYAYLKAGIPIVCALWLFDVREDGKIVEDSVSYHSVTLNGFSFESGSGDEDYSNRLCYYSHRMTKIFAHDDQLCPFTRMDITSYYQYLKSSKEDFQMIKTSWYVKNHQAEGVIKNKVAKVHSLIVPLNQKIRITHKEVVNELTEISNTFTGFLSKEAGLKSIKFFEWDFFLTNVTDLKKDFLKSESLIDKKQLLMKSYPKYLWRAKAVSDKEGIITPLFEVLFDATDSQKGGITKEYVFYNENYKLIHQYLKQFLN